jgi:hypothetical protein
MKTFVFTLEITTEHDAPEYAILRGIAAGLTAEGCRPDSVEVQADGSEDHHTLLLGDEKPPEDPSNIRQERRGS